MQGRFDEKLKKLAGQDFFIAYSGGVDSRVLLDLSMTNHSKSIRGLIHICHHLRPREELETELSNIRRVALYFGLPLFIHHLSPELISQAAKLTGIEAAARQLRYSSIFDIAGPKNLVLVAHHRGDEVETQFINFFRGQDLATLRGIGSYPRINRPMLDFTKEEIRAFASEHKLVFDEDSSNTDQSYLRNLLRNEIIPYVEKRWPRIKAVRIAAAHRVSYDEEFFSELLSHIECSFDSSTKIASVTAQVFFNAPNPLRIRILYKLLSLANGGNPIELPRTLIDEFVGIRALDQNLSSHYADFYYYFDSLSLKVGPAIVASQKNGYLMYLRREESYDIPEFGSIRLSEASFEGKKSSFLLGVRGDMYLRPLTSTLRTTLQSLVEGRIRKDWLLLCSQGACYAISKDSRLDAVCISKADQQTRDREGLWVIRDMES